MIGHDLIPTAQELLWRRYDAWMDARLIRQDYMRGKYVLVTGAADSKGLNAQLLRLLVEMGIAGAILIDVDKRVHDVAKGLDIPTLALECDVLRRETMRNSLVEIEEFLGDSKLSLVVAGAGTFAPSSALNVDIEAFYKVIGVTIVGTMLTYQLASRFADPDHCVFISAGSAAAIAAFPGMVNYNIAKAGLAALTNTLKGEYAGTGWKFHDMAFAQVAGTQLSEWFDKLEFAKEFLSRSRGAQRLNQHARPAPAVRHLARMARGGVWAEVFRFYPIHRVAPLALFPAIGRPIVHAIIGTRTIADADRELLQQDVDRILGKRLTALWGK